MVHVREAVGSTPDDDGSGADRDGDQPADPPIEPGSPSPENVLFVLLGMLMALGVVARLVLLYG